MALFAGILNDNISESYLIVYEWQALFAGNNAASRGESGAF